MPQPYSRAAWILPTTSMETLTSRPIDSYFDLQEKLKDYKTTVKGVYDPAKDPIRVQEEINRHGIEKARGILVGNFTDDFKAQIWEITGTSAPFEFNYEIREENGGARLVHQSDYFTGKDILEVTSKQVRRGLEFDQMVLARQRMLGAEIGTSVGWISLKEQPGEKNCKYPDTQVNIAYKLSEKLIHVRQFQNRDLDLKGSERFFKEFLQLDYVNEMTSLEEVMSTIEIRKGEVSTQEVQEAIAKITGKTLNCAVIDIDTKARSSSEKYVDLLLSGLSGGQQVQVRQNILKGLLPYEVVQKLEEVGTLTFSCGEMEFSGSSRSGSAIPNWCEITPTGEIKCKFCEKKLSKNSINQHQCIC